MTDRTTHLVPLKYYSLPEAAEYVSRKTKREFSVEELVRYAKDGSILFSVIFDKFLFYQFLEYAFYTEACAEYHCSGKDINDVDIGEVESDAREILEKMERYSFDRVFVYLPPNPELYGEAHHNLDCPGGGWAMPINSVLYDATRLSWPISVANTQVKWNGKYLGFVGAFLSDEQTMSGDYSKWFSVGDDIKILEIIATQQQLDRLLSDIERAEKNIGQEALADTWEKVTVSLLANHRIAFKSEAGIREEFAMFELGLIDKKTNKPTKSAEILIDLATGLKHPSGSTANKAEAQRMKRLRASLNSAAKINRNPFKTINASAGWRPRFKLLDRRKAADERAREKAVHVEYLDNRGYDQEDDEAAKWLERYEELNFD